MNRELLRNYISEYEKDIAMISKEEIRSNNNLLKLHKERIKEPEYFDAEPNIVTMEGIEFFRPVGETDRAVLVNESMIWKEKDPYSVYCGNFGSDCKYNQIAFNSSS